jgi:hypothetical protein
MSFNVAMLKAMQAEGLSFDAAIRILEAGEKKDDPTNAARQARHREKKKAESNGVTVTGVTVSPNDSILTPSEPPSVISSEITPPADKSILVLEAWNLMASEAGVPKARMTPERRKKLRTFTSRHKVEDITEAIWAIPRTPFLCGENDRGWKADLDFLLQPKSFNRILEGSYGG